MNKKNLSLVTLLLLLCITSATQALTVSPLFSDHMVLQRDKTLKFWGTATALEKVSVTINNATYTTNSDKQGRWETQIPAQSTGDSVNIIISANDKSITIKDVLFGDVWVASGQSNMEWKLGWEVNNWEQEVKNSQFPEIRFFEVEKSYAFTPQNTLTKGKWHKAGPDTSANFSAIAWFFAKHNHLEKKVPVGIIDSTWGGTPAQAWTPAKRLLKIKAYKASAEDILDTSKNWKTLFNDSKEKDKRKWQLIDDKTAFLQHGIQNKNYNDSQWQSIELPNQKTLSDIVWLRKNITLNGNINNATLYFGDINQIATIFVNGKIVAEENWRDPTTVITLENGILKQGKNTIVLRVLNSWDNRVSVGKKGNLWLQTNKKTMSLEGTWKWSNQVEPTFPRVISYHEKPGALYNAMIQPITNYTINGFLWYQGEANVEQAQWYNELFENMISEWRNQWQLGDLPFLFVQLASFLPQKQQPAQSDWAELREAQTQTLALTNTAMAVTIDIGNADDIHPRNKQDVGKRLWLAAKAIAYGDTNEHSGPVFQSIKTQGNSLIVDFKHIGKGLQIGTNPKNTNTSLLGFDLAGSDGIYYRATAKINKNKVFISSVKVKKPHSVRYAWADNSNANLYNHFGLPAVPFRAGEKR